MQTLKVNLPQDLRAKLQLYQNDKAIANPTEAVVAILNAYLNEWTPSQAQSPLPAMYDAEDGPREVIPSFLDNPHERSSC